MEALFFERVKENHFKAEEKDTLKTNYIVQTIPVSELEIISSLKTTDKKARSKKKEEESKVTEIKVKQKLYVSISATVDSFKVPISSDEEESAHEDSEEADTSTVRNSKVGGKGQEKVKIIGAKKEAATQSLKSQKQKRQETSDEEEDLNISKSMKGVGKKKVKKHPEVYKKGVWNPNVGIIEHCQQLESESLVPNFECSTRNSNREVIRACQIGSKKLLEKIVSSHYKISRLTERWGVENHKTALKVLIDQGNIDLLIFLVDHMPGGHVKKAIEFGLDNRIFIQKIDTGYNDKYAYGVATRTVNVSRGGRQGNNAFVEDNYKAPNRFDDEHAVYFLTNKTTTVDHVKTFLAYFSHLENVFLNKTAEVVRAGRRDIAEYLLGRAIKNDGYGLNEFYIPALVGESKEAVQEIKKQSCSKKAFGMNNLSPILCACLNPNSEILGHLLAMNPEFSSMDDSMRKPSHYAACSETPETLKLLLGLGIDTKDTDSTRMTPLMYACKYGRVENVKFLLHENRSVISAKDRGGYSALHYAAESGSTEILDLLVGAGVKISAPGPDRKTCLHIAAAKGDFETVKHLVEKLGAKVINKDKFKRTPLLLACKNGNLKVASFILQRGGLFNEPDSSGNTPLHYACAYGYPEIIEVLIQAGADPNKGNSWNLSPTAVALLKSYFSCLRKMLENENTDVNCVDDEGRTLISNAIKTISAENFNHAAYLLKDKKADPNISDIKGLTAFDYLCSHNIENLVAADTVSNMHLEVINKLRADKKSIYKKYFKLFIECGSDINHKDKTGLTPIFRCLQANNSDGVTYLLEEKNLEVNILAKDNSTVYHYLENMVCKENFFLMVRSLLSLASQPELLNKYNHNGRTSIHVLFSRFVGLVPGLKGQISGQLQNEYKLRKRETGFKSMQVEGEPKKRKMEKMHRKAMVAEDEEDEDENSVGDSEDGNEEKSQSFFGAAKTGSTGLFQGLKGGARMRFANKSFNNRAHTKGYGETDDEEVYPELNSIALTTEELNEIEKEAENQFKDKIGEFLEFMTYFREKGADLHLLIKNPKKVKESKVEDEEGPEEVEDDYDIFDYFARLHNLIEESIKNKFDIPLADKPSPSTGYSLLHLSAQINNIQILKYLIDTVKIPMNQKSVYSETELLRFIQSNSQSDQATEAIDYLIQKGANPELPNMKSVTPLLFSMMNSKYDFAKTLLKYKVNVNCQDINGNYPLLQAIKNKHLPIIELLLSHKADPNLKDENDRNCIHWSINLSNTDADASNEIENVLLSSGGDLNAVDNRGRTPLHYAFVKIGHPFDSSNIDPIESVSNIISRSNVNIDVRDKWLNTPLNYAAQRGSVISALYLLKHHSDINNINADGNTPLNECLINGHQNMAIFLIQKKADLTVKVKIVSAEEKQRRIEESAKKRKEGRQSEFEDDEDEDDEDNDGAFGYNPHKKMYKRPAKKSYYHGKKMDLEGDAKKDEVEYESSESVLEKDESDNENDDQITDTGNANGFGMNQGYGFAGGAGRFNHSRSTFGQPKFAKRIHLKQATSTEYPGGALESMMEFGPKEKECSTFSIAIRRNWQSVAFLMLEYEFNLSHAILDCFNFKKYNYVYTLLLKKSEAGVYQTTNDLGQNLTHLFALNSQNINTDLYEKILTKLESKELNFSSLDSFKKTSLHYACQSGCMKLIKHLIHKGLDVNVSDLNGMTPLGYITVKSFYNLPEFATFAKDHKLDLNKRFKFGKKEHTVLTYIVAEGRQFDVYSKISELGADINKGDSDGWGPLVYYIRQNREEEVKNFIKSFKNVDTRIKDVQMRTLIHHVVKPREFGAYENVLLLEYLSKFADINEPDIHGNSPLYYAKQQSSGKMAKALLKLRAHESDMEPTIIRTTTSMLNNLEFPHNPYSFEEDFERFVEQAKIEAENTKQKYDEKCPVDKNAIGNYEVVYDEGDPYDAYMVKVDISMGYYSGNTFYKMQILREKVRDVYILFTKWGRVGTDGQYQQTPFGTIAEARKEYCSVFKSKTGNQWEDRKTFVKMDKRYRLVPVEKKTRFESFLKAFNYKDQRVPASHLEKNIFKLIRRICNYKVLSNAIKGEYHIDDSIVPLQSLTKDRLLEAEAIVKGLTSAIEAYEEARKKRNDLVAITTCAEELTKLTSQFYELLPSTRYQQEAIPPITNAYSLGEIRKMLNDLLYFEIAIKLLCAASYQVKNVNPIDYIFHSLTFKIICLDHLSEEYKIIK